MQVHEGSRLVPQQRTAGVQHPTIWAHVRACICLCASMVLSCRRAELAIAHAVAASADFHPAAFEKELVKFADTEEYIVRGGRDKFKNLAKAMQVGGFGRL